MFRLPGRLVYQRLVRFRLTPAALAVLLAAGSAAVHSGALDHGFVNFDDGHFVQDNPFVQEGFTARSVRWAFTAHLTFDAWPYLDYWQPVTVLSRLLDVELFGMDPRGHHATNLLLHALNTALLFLVLESMTGASLAAALSWPPSGVFIPSASSPWPGSPSARTCWRGCSGCSTLAAYHRYVKRPGPSGRRPSPPSLPWA